MTFKLNLEQITLYVWIVHCTNIYAILYNDNVYSIVVCLELKSDFSRDASLFVYFCVLWCAFTETRVLDAFFFWYDFEVAILLINYWSRIFILGHTHTTIDYYSFHSVSVPVFQTCAMMLPQGGFSKLTIGIFERF